MRLSRDNLLTVVLVLAALLLGSVVTSRLPDPDRIGEEGVVLTAAAGQPVRLRTGVFTVTGVEASDQVQTWSPQRTWGDVARTEGVFLVLHVDLTAAGEPRYFPGWNAQIVAADGREFGVWSSVNPTCGPAQPGLTISCMVAFELAPDAVAGASLRLPAANDSIPVSPGENNFALIDLALTPERAAELIAARTPVYLDQWQPKARP